jgi:regulator of replication initiation timing
MQGRKIDNELETTEKALILEENSALKMEVESLKECLRGIVYMAESGLHIKNEFAFIRRIAEAKELCMRGKE